MSTNVTWNGTSYSVPSTSEENWSGATKVDGLLIALANHGFQKTGGAFTLSADADFGATAGLKSIYYKSRGTVATTGVLRLANAEVIAWRNQANGANIPLTVNSSDQLTFNGTVVFSSAGVVPIAAGGTGQTTATLAFDALSPMSALGDLIYGGASGTRTRLAGNATTTLKYLVQTGDGALSAVPAWTQGAFSHLAGNATVAQGGTNLTSYTAGDTLYATGATTLAKLPIGTAGQVLKTNGGATAPEWGSAASALAYASKTNADTGYTITSNDDFILWTLTNTNNNTATLPAASSNAGKKYIIKLAASTAAFNTLTVSRAGSDTITLADGTTGQTSIVFQTSGQTYELISDGVSEWQVTNHRCNTAWAAYTPTIGGFGTVSNLSAFWRRVGDTAEVTITFKSGTPDTGPAVAATLTLPGGTSLDTAKLQGTQLAPFGFYNNTQGSSVGPFVSDSSGVIFYSSVNGASVVSLAEKTIIEATSVLYTANTGSDIANTSSVLSAKFAVPISGWKS